MITSYLVAIRELELDNKIWSVLLTTETLSNLLVNIDESKYEIGDIVSTYAEKSESIYLFLKKDENLETGKEG